ncbi:hypothetical protein ACFB49_31480 [Sphingomonas sp. DBB INV C78]|uniref:GNAT family N-acetyltransferase n=1 Tax=Sphingomonas sp. DBB INV C78 TaxID=3349434 RepID=UPI0036D3D73A
MSFVLREDEAAIAAIAPGGIALLTERATTTFDRDDLTEEQRAANRRVVAISTGCCEDAARNSHQYFAAGFTDEGALAGYVIATRHGPDDHELDWLMVAPEHHGSALSRLLMEAGVDWLGRDRPMWLNVIRFNARAIAFYMKFGFAVDPDARTAHAVPHFIMRRPPD